MTCSIIYAYSWSSAVFSVFSVTVINTLDNMLYTVVQKFASFIFTLTLAIMGKF